MISPLIGLAVAITLAQAVAVGQPARPASGSSRVWNTLEFVPTDSGSQRLPKALKFQARVVQPQGQIELTPCTRMPRMKVDASVDPKIIVPLPPNASNARIRIVGEEMPTCPTR